MLGAGHRLRTRQCSRQALSQQFHAQPLGVLQGCILYCMPALYDSIRLARAFKTLKTVHDGTMSDLGRVGSQSAGSDWHSYLMSTGRLGDAGNSSSSRHRKSLARTLL